MNECLLAGGGGAVLELALGLGLLLFAAERDTDTRRAGNEPSRILKFHREGSYSVLFLVESTS